MHRSTASRTSVAVVLGAFLLSMTACVGWEEHMCSEGAYPTWRPDGPGATCFPDGEEPTPGYVRYPEEDVPELVEDDYRPPERYPELVPWVEDYVAWLDSGADGRPPPMPPVG